MSYRLPPRPSGRAPIIHATEQSDLVVDNGTIAHVAIPFFRKRGVVTRADVMRVDHCGWPHPGRRDRSWQPWMAFNSLPIDLAGEGYESVDVAFGTQLQGLAAVGSIAENYVLVDVTAMCPDAEGKDVSMPFSIYMVGEGMRDVAMKGVLRIVAGPINEG